MQKATRLNISIPTSHIRQVLIMLMVATSAVSIHASSYSIDNGTTWNCGSLDYTAEYNANGTIALTGCTEGQDLGCLFTPVPGKDGEYRLSAWNPDECENPFYDSTKARHIRKDGQNLLCLYDDQNRLNDVLTPLQYPDGLIQAEQKWTRQLMGKYSSQYDEPLTIGPNGKMQFSSINLTYRHVNFNGMIIGVIEITGGTRLEGLWEVEITRDGLTLHKVEKDEYEKTHRTGEEEVFSWASKDVPRFEYASKVLLNDDPIRRLDPKLLRLIRNEIWFHHGYVPVSEDLQEYLADKEWYTPRQTNDGIYNELSTIELLNIERIKTIETNKELYDSSDDQDDSDDQSFNIEKYRKDMVEQAEANLMWMKSTDDINLVSYALIDVDNDGIDEVWVKDDGGQDFQGVFGFKPDGSITLLQNSDARSELTFYPGAVVSTGYYGEGEFKEFFTTIENSRQTGYGYKRVLINNYSEDQEVLEEEYNINGKDVTEAKYNAFIKSLGEPYQPQVEWHQCD